MENLMPDMVHVAIGIRIYPGCEIAQIAQKEDYISPKDSLLNPTIYLSSQVKDWIFDYMAKVRHQNPTWVI
jgi:hypothetical protein